MRIEALWKTWTCRQQFLENQIVMKYFGSTKYYFLSFRAKTADVLSMIYILFKKPISIANIKGDI